jgi:hypothetical protein
MSSLTSRAHVAMGYRGNSAHWGSPTKFWYPTLALIQSQAAGPLNGPSLIGGRKLAAARAM